MAIKNIQANEPGQSGVDPRIIRIDTDDPVATVVAAGYLTDAVKKGLIDLKESDMCLVVTKESASAAQEAGWYEVSKSGSTWSLVPPASPGDVVLPTVANRLAHFSNTTGTLSGVAADVVNDGDLALGSDGTEGLLTLYPASASSGNLIVKAVDSSSDVAVTISNADHGQASVYSIPDGGQATANFIISESSGTQNIASGNLQVDTGNIIAGSDANAGYLESHPGTTNSGTLRLAAVDSSTDSAVTISNADHGQATVVSIPDGGQATANFVLTETASSQQINGTTITYADNATSFRLKGPSSPNDPSAGADVQSYSGMFYNDSYDTFGVLKTRATFGANAQMDLVLQAPRGLLLIAQDGGQSDGVIKAASQTNIQFHARYAAEQVTNWAYFDRTDTGSAGSGNTSAVTLNTNDDHLHLQNGVTTHAIVLPKVAEGSVADLVSGILIYDSSANKLKFYNGSGWETVTSS